MPFLMERLIKRVYQAKKQLERLENNSSDFGFSPNISTNLPLHDKLDTST